MLRSRASILARMLTAMILACLVGCPLSPVPCQTDVDCDNANACTDDVCVEGSCVHTDVTCVDGDLCTTDSCDPDTGCVFEPLVCDVGFECVDGVCVAPIWSDEFEGSAIDPANWEHMIGDGSTYGLSVGWGNNELQYYTDRPENSFVADGYLHVVAREEPFEGYNYTSARLRTKNHQDFLYGRLEARIQLPTGQGVWPAFWMLPTDEIYGGWAASGEIDIMESANIPTAIDGAIHFGGPWPNNTSLGGTFSDGTDFSRGFNTFAIEWRPDAIAWYVDGVPYHTETSANWYSDGDPGNGCAPFDQLFYLLLNVAVGGNFPGPPDGSATFPQEMLIDWVRAYGLPGGRPTGQCVSVQFQAPTYSALENTGTISIAVVRRGDQTSEVTVTYMTSGGTATPGSDYATAAATLVFAAGETSKSFTVTVLADFAVEGDETVNLVLSNPTGGASLGDPSTAVLTILDDDGPGQIQFNAQAYSVREDQSSTTITVTRTGDPAGQVGVAYATSGGTATAGSDYATATGTLVFAAGETSKSFTVTVLPDTAAEDNETVNLVLSNPTGGVSLGDPSTAVLTIVDAPPCAGGTHSYQYGDFLLTDVCTFTDNWCEWADRPGKAVVYGEMSKVVQVPPSCTKLDVTIFIPCNGWGEGLKGPDGSSAHVIVNGVIRAEPIDDTMEYHHEAFYRYEYCESFVSTFDVTGEAQAELIIRMNGEASLDFQQATLEFHRD